MRITMDVGSFKPSRAHPNDAGLDLYAMHSAVIPPCGHKMIETGIHAEIPVGYVGLLTSKSGLMSRGITSRGTIDSGYTGSIKAVLYNHSHSCVEIEAGQKITQMVILPIITPELEVVDSLDETDRADGGFGSSGK